MSDKVIKFTIKINSETGEVVALRKEFDELSNATQKTTNNYNAPICQDNNLENLVIIC